MTEKIDYLSRCIGKKIRLVFLTEWSITGILRSFNSDELCVDVKDEVVIVRMNSIAYYKRLDQQDEIES